MKYYLIEAEVAGGFGHDSIIDRTSGRMVVKKLHYQCDGWLGDELLETVADFIVTERLARELEREQLTGIKFDEVKVTTSEEFADVCGDLPLPRFVWLKAEGQAGRDDFGLSEDLVLVVSERAYEVLKRFEVSHANVYPFET